MKDADLTLEDQALDAEALAVLRAERARRALQQAPEAAAHIRSLLEPSDGRTERGAVFAVMTTPLHTGEADDADDLFARLVEWALFWADTLEVQPPASGVAAWQGWNEAAGETVVRGFKAGTTVEGARMLMRLQTLWLLTHHEKISGHESAEVYQDDVAELVRTVRGRYGLTAVRERMVRPRPCPTCGEAGVRAWWPTEDVLQVEIVCEFCHAPVEATRPSEMLRWVAPVAEGVVLSEACAEGLHEVCEAVACECECHQHTIQREATSFCSECGRSVGHFKHCSRQTEGADQ